MCEDETSHETNQTRMTATCRFSTNLTQLRNEPSFFLTTLIRVQCTNSTQPVDAQPTLYVYRASPITSEVFGVRPSERRPPGRSNRWRATAFGGTPSLGSGGAQVCWLASCLGFGQAAEELLSLARPTPTNLATEDVKLCPPFAQSVRDTWLPCADGLPQAQQRNKTPTLTRHNTQTKDTRTNTHFSTH